MNNTVIYCLVEVNGAPFYVGRSNNWHRRAHEHRTSAKKGHEAKYQHIRKLWASGRDFELVVLDENPSDRYEKYYHYILGCEYDLTNQRMGDKQAAEVAACRAMREAGRDFATASQFLTALDQEVAEAKAREAAARIQARIRSDRDDTERTLIAGERINDRFMSPALKEFYDRKTKGTKRG